MEKIDIETIDASPIDTYYGSHRANATLERLFGRVGVFGAVIVDKNGKIISGREIWESWAEVMPEGPKWAFLAKVRQNTPVVVQISDFDLSDPKNPALDAQISLQRAFELGAEWAFENLSRCESEGDLDLSEHFFPSELRKIAEKWAKREKLPPKSGSKGSVLEDSPKVCPKCGQIKNPS